ncbi:MAG: orotate phosphoribosyltransferase [Rhodospirillales bacterium]
MTGATAAAAQAPVENANGAERRRRLLHRLRELAMISGSAVKLASGRTSDIYFDMKMPMFDAETINLIADEMLDRLTEEGAESIGGLEMGAVPLVAAVVCRSWPARPVKGFFVRKTVKEHGTQKRIEGHFDPAGSIVLLDDVTTTAGSVLEAVRAVRERGATVRTVLTIVDREEGATENLAAEGLRLRALFTRADFRD